MRIGLLTRFMGILGIALGPAFVLQFGSLILPLWLIALGALFAGRWPRRPPTRRGSPARRRPGPSAEERAEPPLPTLPRAGGGGPQRRGRARRPGCAARRPAARPARPRIGWRRMGAPKAFLATGLALRRCGPGGVRGRASSTPTGPSRRSGSGITRQTGVKIDTRPVSRGRGGEAGRDVPLCGAGIERAARARRGEAARRRGQRLVAADRGSATASGQRRSNLAAEPVHRRRPRAPIHPGPSCVAEQRKGPRPSGGQGPVHRPQLLVNHLEPSSGSPSNTPKWPAWSKRLRPPDGATGVGSSRSRNVRFLQSGAHPGK